MSYSPEQIEATCAALAQGAPILVEPKDLRKGIEMLRAYAATLRQAARVDESAIERLRNALKMFDEHRTTMQSLASSVGDFLREAALSAQPAPIPMVLHCPSCHLQHIDAPDIPDSEQVRPGPTIGWTNPPHRSHLCHGCGTIWRPADVPTVGVAAIQTRGKADVMKPAQPAPPRYSWSADGKEVLLTNPEDDPGYWTDQPAERQGEGNKTMLQIMEGSAWRASLIGLCVAPKEADVSTPEKAAANVRARLARSATPVGVPDRALLRAIVDAAWNEATESRQVPSTEWADRIIDGVLAAPSAPHVNAGLGIPSCGKPLCSENDHHPLCPSAPQGVE